MPRRCRETICRIMGVAEAVAEAGEDMEVEVEVEGATEDVVGKVAWASTEGVGILVTGDSRSVPCVTLKMPRALSDLH